MDGNGDILSDLRELLTIATVEEVPYFLYLLENNRDIRVKVEAALTLGKSGFKEAVEPMIEILRKEKNILVRDAIECAFMMINPEVYSIRPPAESFLKRGKYVEAIMKIFENEDRKTFDLSLMLFDLTDSTKSFADETITLTGREENREIEETKKFNSSGSVSFYNLPGGNYEFCFGPVMKRSKEETIDTEGAEDLPHLKSCSKEDVLNFVIEFLKETEVMICATKEEEPKWEQIKTEKGYVQYRKQILPDLNNTVQIKLEFKCKEDIRLKYSLMDKTDKVIINEYGESHEGVIDLYKKGELFRGEEEIRYIDSNKLPVNLVVSII